MRTLARIKINGFMDKCIIGLLLLLFMTNGCCHFNRDNPDPFEKYNRYFFRLNVKMDQYFLKPVAQAYNRVLPQCVRESVENFFNNFLISNTIGNDILQGDFYFALQDTWRVVINTTLGIGGLFDVSKKIGLPQHNTDFGITMMKWGVRYSPYLVVPFWGPTTIRDGIGTLVDYYAFSPYFWLLRTAFAAQYSMWALNGVSIRAGLLKYDKIYQQIAFDPYIFNRTVFLQRRETMLKQSIENTGFAPPEPFDPVFDHPERSSVRQYRD